jgi:anti-anti-sigma factor
LATQPFFLRGELDISTAPRFRQELAHRARAGGDELILDCSALTFIDASAVAALVEAHRELSSEGRELHVVNAQPQIARVFGILGLTEVLHVRDVPQPPRSAVLQLCARAARYSRLRAERQLDRAKGDA